MRRFNVTVNGTVYDVVVEETDAGSAAPVAAAPKAAPAAPKAAPAAPKAAPAASSGSAGATAIKAPMPGTIVKVNVNPGDKVSKGDVLCVLEAMKMENDIVAPRDGKITSVVAQKGASVNSGDVLFTLA